MTRDEQIVLVNSRNEAMNFWLTNFGEPDYFTTPQDVVEIELLIADLQKEFESLKRGIVYNENHFKLNKIISLHFVINEGEHYLASLNLVIESKCVPVEEETFADEYGHPYDREFDDASDPWREDSLFSDDFDEDDFNKN